MFGIITIIGFASIFLVVHMLQNERGTIKEAWQSVLETLPGVNNPNIRCAEMESAFGTPWLTWDPEASPETEFDRPAIQIGCLQRYFGPMDMDVAGDQVLIYDMQLSPGITEHPTLAATLGATGSFFQTVISIKPPELQLPPFCLHPKLNRQIFHTGNSILTDSALDKRYTLDSLAPHRIKSLFQSELGSRDLIPFLNDRKWTIQWTGKCLIAYKFNQLIAPERLAEAALELSEFFEHLKSGPAAIDQGIKKLIQEMELRANHNSETVLQRR